MSLVESDRPRLWSANTKTHQNDWKFVRFSLRTEACHAACRLLQRYHSLSPVSQRITDENVIASELLYRCIFGSHVDRRICSHVGVDYHY